MIRAVRQDVCSPAPALQRADLPGYELIGRLLLEQYRIEGVGSEQRAVLEAAEEIAADSRPSSHDEYAAHLKKNDQTVRGDSANVSEACDEQLNLILDVQVEPASSPNDIYAQPAARAPCRIARPGSRPRRAEAGFGCGLDLLLGRGLAIMPSTETVTPELIDVLPELGRAPDRIGQGAQAEHNLGIHGFPAHAGGA